LSKCNVIVAAVPSPRQVQWPRCSN